MKNVQTLKGFRDFLPVQARKRQYVIDVLKKTFEQYGFEPLETPTLEYEELLTGKYGNEGDKLMYRFTDNGGRQVAMRYDQTVPLARVIAQNENELPMPFKRYQIQNVWRAENTQKGRYREFIQIDADTVGCTSLLSDAEIIAVAIKGLENLGFKNFQLSFNDRSIFTKLVTDTVLTNEQMFQFVRAIDKIKKIGKEGVLTVLEKSSFGKEEAEKLLNLIETQEKTDTLRDIDTYIQNFGLDKKTLNFDPTLARGLDYYTGMIFEVEIDGYDSGSVAGGGRFDNLIGIFSGKKYPAVGFAFGFDRIMEAMDQLSLFPDNLRTVEVLVTIFSSELSEKSLKIASLLREKNINTEVYLDDSAKIEKQLKYANQKGIPYVVILGPDEVKKDIVKIKNMQSGEQKEIAKDKLSLLF